MRITLLHAVLGTAALAVSAASPFTGPAAFVAPRQDSADGRPAGLAEGIERATFRWGRSTAGGWVLVASFDLTPGWHSYWENPGDSGDAPHFNVQVPAGWQAGRTVFLRPDVKLIDGSPFYGYEGRATYLVPVTKVGGNDDDAGWTSPDASGQPRAWKVDARIMACQSRCTMSRASARGEWPPSADAGTSIDLNGGTFEGRSIPRTAKKAGVFAKLEVGKVTIDVPGELGSTAQFIPAGVPGMQVALPDGKAAIEGASEGGNCRIKFRPDSLGSGPGEPAVAGLVLLGWSPSEPCIWLTIPHPLAGPGDSLGANGVGSGSSLPPGP